MQMRYKIFLTVLMLFVCSAPLYARLGVQMSLNRSVFIKYERIYACVTLRNDSGKPLLFGRDPALQGFLMFDVRDNFNRPIGKRKNSEISITGLQLAPGEVRRMVFRLSDHYQLERSGKFKVHVYVAHNALKHEFRSRDVYFEISEGNVVWKRTVGLPALEGKPRNGDYDERTYTIRTLSEPRSIGYYLVVEDDKKVYGVVRVGSVVGYEQFQAEIDMLSRLHLLMPVAPKVFHYLAFNSAGQTLENSYWKTSGTIPSLLRNNKNGRVDRVGGVPARQGVDYHLRSRDEITVSEIVNDRPKQRKGPARDSGIVDLGQGVMADAPGSRDGE